jgi:outer membrane immunogenic protein
MTALYRVLVAGIVLWAAVAPCRAQDSGADGGWGGAYLGLAAGLKYGSTEWTARQLNGGDPTSFIDSSSPRTYRIPAFRLGAFAGFNWQQANWVFGPEIDFAWSDTKETRNFIPGCASAACGAVVPSGPNDTSSVTLKWDGSVRGRLGYLVAPTLLIYGTAGLALQDIAATGTCLNPSLNSQYCFGPGFMPPRTAESVFLGPTVGGGVETKLAGGWLLRAEYRFSYFPSMNGTLLFPPSDVGNSNIYRFRLSAQTHMLTLGVAYRFLAR